MDFAIDFITNVLGNPTVMLGIIACIGLIFLRKSVSDIVMGTVKTMMGYLILSAGTTIIGTPITLLTTLVQRGLGVDGVLPLVLGGVFRVHGQVWDRGGPDIHHWFYH